MTYTLCILLILLENCISMIVIKRIQNLSTGSHGNRSYNNSSDFQNAIQSTTHTPNQQNRIICYSCGQLALIGIFFK